MSDKLPNKAHGDRRPWKWAEEIDRILELRDQGMTLRELGDQYGVSRERIRQIIYRERQRLKAVKS